MLRSWTWYVSTSQCFTNMQCVSVFWSYHALFSSLGKYTYLFLLYPLQIIYKCEQDPCIDLRMLQ